MVSFIIGASLGYLISKNKHAETRNIGGQNDMVDILNGILAEHGIVERKLGDKTIYIRTRDCQIVPEETIKQFFNHSPYRRHRDHGFWNQHHPQFTKTASMANTQTNNLNDVVDFIFNQPQWNQGFQPQPQQQVCSCFNHQLTGRNVFESQSIPIPIRPSRQTQTRMPSFDYYSELFNF